MKDKHLDAAMLLDAQYKDVVIVGNGPSGLALSYLLSGHWPYLTPAGGPGSHPDELLAARLSGLEGRSLLDQDLRFLSQGLEGRTTQPVSLLVDALSHPGADAGLELPSLLQWRHNPEGVVDHVVLGKGPPGGAWQAMDGNVLTVSLASWMALPGLDFHTWKQASQGDADGPDDDGNTVPNKTGKGGRALVASVAQYYLDYVRLTGIYRFLRNGMTVTNIEPLCDDSIPCQKLQKKALWRVDGFDNETGDRFCYITEKVVLATGATDQPNRLNVPGEGVKSDLLVHDLRSFETGLARLRSDMGKTGSDMIDPVLVVGAGLSAADAIIAARFHSIPILHVFRSRHIPIDRQLPEIMYPEYHKVQQMMGDEGEGYPLYQSLPEHKVLSLTGLGTPHRKVVLEGPKGDRSAHKVSLAGVLIGARPDLSFLQNVCVPGGIGLGVNEKLPIDCRSNPFLVDPWTHQVIRSPHPGLYSLGPLSGDNFVRFIIGGAVAFTAGIHYTQRRSTAV